MSSRFSLKVVAGQNDTQNIKNFLFMDESNADSVEMLIEQFSLSMLAKRINRENDINEKIKIFLEIRHQLLKQINSYQSNIKMIYDSPINGPYVMSDLCQYLIKNCKLSEFLDQGTSMLPLSHEIIFIGSVRPAVDTVLYFKKD